MKYGVHCYVFTDRWSDDKLNLLDKAKGLGMDCFDIALGDDVKFTLNLTRQRAETLGLELSVSPGGCWPIECDLSADSRLNRKLGLNWHKKLVDLGSELGAVAYSGALYGHPGVVRKCMPPADEYDRIADVLYQLAEYGERRGIKIVLEPMSHFRTHLANTPEQVMRLVNKTDHSNLYVLLDTYHMITEVRDYAQAIRTVCDRLWGIHASENDRGVPGGGLVPWNTVFLALDEINFKGYIIFESYNTSIGDFSYQRGIFHDVCQDGSGFVRKALAFVKKAQLNCSINKADELRKDK